MYFNSSVCGREQGETQPRVNMKHFINKFQFLSTVKEKYTYSDILTKQNYKNT
jgi:uncharacterized protein Veg